MTAKNQKDTVEKKKLTREEIFAALESVEDPEIALNVVDLGLIYDVSVLDNRIVNIIMTLTFPGCPYGPSMIADIEGVIAGLNGVEKVDVEVVWEPPWDPATMASDYAKDVLGIW
jgi:metal-sulfur cluster biosynthetic enzyme